MFTKGRSRSRPTRVVLRSKMLLGRFARVPSATPFGTSQARDMNLPSDERQRQEAPPGAAAPFSPLQDEEDRVLCWAKPPLSKWIGTGGYEGNCQRFVPRSGGFDVAVQRSPAASESAPRHPSDSAWDTIGAVVGLAPLVTSVRHVTGRRWCEGLDQTKHAPWLPQTHAALSLSELGLPECTLVLPRRLRAAAILESPPSHAKMAVVVDAACGEAVLRGSDVFAPGILASSGHYAPGDSVFIMVPFAGGVPPAKGSLWDVHVGATPRYGIVGWGRVRMARKDVVVGGRGPAASRPSMLPNDRRSEKVPQIAAPGDPTAAIPPDVEVDEAGIAVRNDWNPGRHLPSRLLFRTSTQASTNASRDPRTDDMLQNWSSLVPPALLCEAVDQLVDDIAASVTADNVAPAELSEVPPRPIVLYVLDMCAAPGGKTSHLLSLLKDHPKLQPSSSLSSSQPATSECDTNPDNPPAERRRSVSFHLVCCERSRARCRSMEAMLTKHHGAAFMSRHVTVLCGDGGAATSIPGCPTRTFHLILLDPPCSGLGLRPRLRPHEHGTTHVVQAADYQWRLLRSANDMLARHSTAARIVYSTCTTTVEENEGVVRLALDRFTPRGRSPADDATTTLKATDVGEGALVAAAPAALRLVQCKTPKECKLLRMHQLSTSGADQVHQLSSRHTAAAAATTGAVCWRFGPSPSLVDLITSATAPEVGDTTTLHSRISSGFGAAVETALAAGTGGVPDAAWRWLLDGPGFFVAAFERFSAGGS